jgi:hypothetical protein
MIVSASRRPAPCQGSPTLSAPAPDQPPVMIPLLES